MHMMKEVHCCTKRFRVICLLLYLLPASLVQSSAWEDRSLPDVDELVEKIRDNLHSDRFLLRKYIYSETQEVIELDKKGRAKKTRIRIYEIFPSIVDELTYRRLISKDGEPLKEKELRKQDRKYEKRVRKYAEKAKNNGLPFDSEFEASEEELLRREEKAVDEVFRLYRFESQGREQLDGHATVVVDFIPRPEFKTEIKEVKLLKKIKGRAWISEDDYQSVRIDAETMKNLKFGLGLIAKLNKGARMVFRRRKINDEIWLPAEASFSGTGRVLVFKGFRFQAKSEYFGYKKFSVNSRVSFLTVDD